MCRTHEDGACRQMRRLIALSFLAVICAVPLEAQIISTRAGTVKKVEGEAFYRCHLNEKEASPLEKGLKLHEEDTLLTTKEASVVITLNPDSYLLVGADAFLRVKQTTLDAMHFDIERGEIFVFVRSLEDGVSLVIHTPPAVLMVYEKGDYRFLVEENGNTEANVVRGKLRYTDNQNNPVRVKKGKKVNFVKRASGTLQIPGN